MFRYMVFKNKLKSLFFKDIAASVFINLSLIIKIKNVFLVIYIYQIYVIMKTMCPPIYHHNGFVATDI